jgi:hypothetical protein
LDTLGRTSDIEFEIGFSNGCVTVRIEKHGLVAEKPEPRRKSRGRQLRLTYDERGVSRSARGQRLGPDVLGQVAAIGTLDVIIRWHRQHIVSK